MQRFLFKTKGMQDIKKAISQYIGKGIDNAKNNKMIRQHLANLGMEVSESDLRKHIEDLRESPLTDDVLLADTTHGYYYDINEEQVIRYMEQLNSRILQIRYTLANVQRHFERKYRKSATLFLQPAVVKEALKAEGFVFHGCNMYWHPVRRIRLLFDGKKLGTVKSVYDTKLEKEFFSIEDLKSYIATT